MAHADWIIDLGPGAGHDGGRIVFEGTPGRPRRRTARPSPASTSPPTSAPDRGDPEQCSFSACTRWHGAISSGSDRGSPNQGSTLFSKRVMAQIRSPARVRTIEAGPVADAVGGAQVGAERRLTVGSRRHEVEPAARAEDAGAEAGHDVSALVFERHRRHRHEDVVGQQGHQRVEIGGLPRADELRHDRILGG